jgi:hypothetical protein
MGVHGGPIGAMVAVRLVLWTGIIVRWGAALLAADTPCLLALHRVNKGAA